jgi:hypothetical protein
MLITFRFCRQNSVGNSHLFIPWLLTLLLRTEYDTRRTFYCPPTFHILVHVYSIVCFRTPFPCFLHNNHNIWLIIATVADHRCFLLFWISSVTPVSVARLLFDIRMSGLIYFKEQSPNGFPSVTEFSEFYGTRWLVAVSTTVDHFLLSWAICNNYSLSHLISLMSFFNIIIPSTSSSSNIPFSLQVITQPTECNSIVPHACYMTSHHICLYLIALIISEPVPSGRAV